MRILLLNPNASPSITDLVAREAAKLARPGTELVPVTGAFGGRYIASRATFAVAEHAALDAWARHADGIDGVLLACFGDPGLAAIKELSPVPVVGLVEASLAATVGRRFGIVTGGALWEAMLRESVTLAGAAGALASIRTVAPKGADIARDPEGSLDLLARACAACATEDGAETVILGGAGLAGLAPSLRPRVPVPLIDGLEAGMAAIQDALVRPRPSAAGAPGIDSVGLSPALAARLAAR
ncbi:MAG: aspartate/glutamate racemase family protein [Tagaea sp.]